MNSNEKDLGFEFQRTIHASPEEVFDAWLSPKVPGTPWNMAEKLILQPQVDGLFYWSVKTQAHYGRFIGVDRPFRLHHSWVSPSTLGQESMVTVTFEKKGDSTLMTLRHSGLPDSDGGRGHERGWNYFLDIFPGQVANAPKKDG
jgi:uncharacterized protein YndB with AHSA1/START domain